MSGGAFDYKQHFIEYMADEIEQKILNSGRKIPQEVLKRDPWIGYWDDDFNVPRYYPQYNRKTIDIMKRAVYVLRMAYIYAQRVDWMLSMMVKIVLLNAWRRNLKSSRKSIPAVSLHSRRKEFGMMMTTEASVKCRMSK